MSAQRKIRAYNTIKLAPDSRRGHWHHFWTGAKDKPEERKLVLKWVAPTMIHGDHPNETTTVVKIKGE